MNTKIEKIKRKIHVAEIIANSLLAALIMFSVLAASSYVKTGVADTAILSAMAICGISYYAATWKLDLYDNDLREELRKN